MEINEQKNENNGTYFKKLCILDLDDEIKQVLIFLLYLHTYILNNKK